MDEWHEDSESISRLQTAILKGITDSEAIVKKAGLTASSITISSTIEEDEETTAHNHHPLALAQHSLVKAFAIHALLMCKSRHWIVVK